MPPIFNLAIKIHISLDLNPIPNIYLLKFRSLSNQKRLVCKAIGTIKLAIRVLLMMINHSNSFQPVGCIIARMAINQNYVHSPINAKFHCRQINLFRGNWDIQFSTYVCTDGKLILSNTLLQGKYYLAVVCAKLAEFVQRKNNYVMVIIPWIK